MKNEKSNLSNNLLYLLVGGGIGATLALLFAPKTGVELRTDIADVTRKGLDKTGEIANQLGDTAQTVYSETKTKAGEIYNVAKEKVNSATNAISEIPGELKTAVRHTAGQISSSIEAGKKEFERTETVNNLKNSAKAS